MKIIEYKTAAADSLKELDAAVNEFIQEGFQPYGNPYHISREEGVVDAPVCQAVVRFE